MDKNKQQEDVILILKTFRALHKETLTDEELALLNQAVDLLNNKCGFSPGDDEYDAGDGDEDDPEIEKSRHAFADMLNGIDRPPDIVPKQKRNTISVSVYVPSDLYALIELTGVHKSTFFVESAKDRMVNREIPLLKARNLIK